MILVHCTPFEPIFLKEHEWFRIYVWFNVVILVLHSGDYYMFESDSGEEEESFQEEQKPRRQTGFQVTCFVLTLFYVWWGGFYGDMCVKCLCLNCFPQLAYQAWVTSAKEALKDRQQRQKEQRAEAKKQQTSPATG